MGDTDGVSRDHGSWSLEVLLTLLPEQPFSRLACDWSIYISLIGYRALIGQLPGSGRYLVSEYIENHWAWSRSGVRAETSCGHWSVEKIFEKKLEKYLTTKYLPSHGQRWRSDALRGDAEMMLRSDTLVARQRHQAGEPPGLHLTNVLRCFPGASGGEWRKIWFTRSRDQPLWITPANITEQSILTKDDKDDPMSAICSFLILV